MSRFPCGQWTPFPLNECTIPPSLMWGEGREIDTFGNTEVMENVTCRLCFSVLSRVMAFASIVVVNARKWRPERKIPAGCFKSVVPLNTGVLVVKNILNAQLFQTELDHLRRFEICGQSKLNCIMGTSYFLPNHTWLFCRLQTQHSSYCVNVIPN